MTEIEKEQLHRTIGDNIRVAREKMHLKQEDLADKIGLSRASIINIEKGRQSPPLYLIWEISKVLEVSIQSFFPIQELQDSHAQNKTPKDLKEKISKSLKKHFHATEDSGKVLNFILTSSVSS